MASQLLSRPCAVPSCDGRIDFHDHGTLCRSCRWEKQKADDRSWIGRYLAAKWADLKAEDIGASSIRDDFLWCKIHGDSSSEGHTHLSSISTATCGCGSSHVQHNAMHFGVIVKGKMVGAGCATSRNRFNGMKDGEKVPVTMDPRHVSCGNCRSRILSVLKEASA